MTDTANQDVVDVLTADHRDVTALIGEIWTIRDPMMRRDLADTAISELVRHAVAEEMYVYPAMRKHLPDGDERWLAAKFVVVPVLDGATGFVATFEDVTESRRREASLSWEARHDLLTGLANRQGFEDALRAVVSA